MSTVYTPTAVSLGNITIPADGDNATASSINTPICAVADGVKYLASRLGVAMHTFTAVKYMTGNPQLTFAEVGATGDTITRLTGSWITDGFVAGDVIMVEGSAAGNNIRGIVQTVTATVLTMDTTDLAAEGPATGFTVRGQVPVTVPTGAAMAAIIMYGGGGGAGGGAGGATAADVIAMSGSGGGGAIESYALVAVTPGQVLGCAVGPGGAGGAGGTTGADGSNGTDGADSVVFVSGGAELARAKGAAAGQGGTRLASAGTGSNNVTWIIGGTPTAPLRSNGTGSQTTPFNAPIGVPLCPAQGGYGRATGYNATYGTGATSPKGYAGGAVGSDGASDATYRGGASGGSGGGGPGGAGGASGNGGAGSSGGIGGNGVAGTAAAANTGAGGGGGGSGGGAAGGGGPGAAGAAGGSGKVIIAFFGAA